MKVKLGDLTKIRTGKLDANASSENGAYPFFTCSKEPLRIDTYTYDCECVLVAGNGDLNVKYYNGKFDVYQRTYIIEDNGSGQLYMPYLYFFMDGYIEELRKQAIGGVIKYIKLGNLTDALIELPDIETQKEIVDILKKAKCIVERRNKELQKLDELIKARFVEMFGYPFDTSKWNIKELKELSESMLDGSNVNTDHYESEGEVLFLRIQNVWRNEFRLDDSVYISQDINKEKYYDTSLKNGDLLITKIGRYYTKDSSLGRVSIYRGKDDCANYSNNIMCVRLNDNMNSEFVNALLNLDEYQSFIKRTSKGGTDKRALSKSLIGSYPIIMPPKELQIEYVDFVKQVDKSKVVVQEALDKAQLLFDSLMQEYFG